eukprot:GHVL01019844.1.p1 GENE.GHVL01019844.1~~GHVL01019844.1.p1  ORF type:complete len:415 (+),score=67.06 GHVL01019844.1:72-1316(+)
MPKAEVGTNKWLSNKMKAKGLQRLRWFCQMCEKQCRDENGFKCHRMSEAHQRQMQIFCQNPGRFMDDFSKEFEHSYMRLMRTRYYNTRVLANTVYCDVIADKQHVHMNSTIWVTLTGFVHYLQRSGQCEVDNTEKGWYIKYIDRSPEKLARDNDRAQREKDEGCEVDREQKLLEQIVNKAKEDGCYKKPEFTDIQRKDDDDKVTFVLPVRSGQETRKSEPSIKLECNIEDPKKNKQIEIRSEKVNVLEMAAIEASKDSEHSHTTVKRKLTAMEEIKLEEEAKKKKQPVVIKKEKCEREASPDDRWISVGLVVKVLAPGQFCGVKGAITKIEQYNAVLKMKSNKQEKVKVNQDQLETVIPNIGGKVLILNGRHRGKYGLLKNADFETAECSVELDKETVHKLQYEDICKTSLSSD